MFKVFLAILSFSCFSVVCCDKERIFTADELIKFNGEDDTQPIYMAIKGLVYDVTKGRDFYGKKGSYNVFAGKDCTRAVAKWSKDPEDMIPSLDGLTEKQLEGLEKAINSVYKPKYPVIGQMDYYKPIAKEL